MSVVMHRALLSHWSVRQIHFRVEDIRTRSVVSDERSMRPIWPRPAKLTARPKTEGRSARRKRLENKPWSALVRVINGGDYGKTTDCRAYTVCIAGANENMLVQKPGQSVRASSCAASVSASRHVSHRIRMLGAIICTSLSSFELRHTRSGEYNLYLTTAPALNVPNNPHQHAHLEFADAVTRITKA